MTEEPPNYPPPNYPPPSYPPPSYPPPNYPPPNYPPPNYPPAAPGGYEYPSLSPSGYGGYGGYGYPPAYPQYSGTSTNGLAIASLVASIAGFFTCGIGSVLGLIFGLVALNQIKRTGQGGRGLAIAGIAVSAVTFALFMGALFISSITRHNRTDNDTYSSQHAVLVIPAPQHTEQQQAMALGRILCR